MPVSGTKKPAHPLDGNANEKISRKLKELYDSVQDEGIPERFLDLLERLDAADEAARAAGKVGKTGGADA